MTSYINQYKENILEGKSNATLSNISVGDVIRFDYPKSSNNKQPHVLVLNKNYKGLMHALVIDYMSPREMKFLKKWTISEFKEVRDDSTNDISKLIKELVLKIGDPVTFYEFRFKKFIQTKIKSSPYRTYKVTDIKNIKLMNVKWELI